VSSTWVTRARVEEFPALARENALLAIDRIPPRR
jgi:hypothetical protein